MGLVTRHSAAPFAHGERLEAVDLELDFATVYDLVNANIDNANIAAGANISGTKIASASITNGQVALATLATTNLAPAAVPKHHADYSSVSTSWTASTSLADMTQFAGVALTPGATTDMIFMDICLQVDPSATGDLIMGFSVNGTDYDDITTFSVTSTWGNRIFFSTYALLAPATTSMTIKPRHKVANSGAATIDSGMFRCWILPGK